MFDALLLGILQGLTEFLPVSSSGHLVLGEHFLGLQFDPAALQGVNVILHAGTLLALLVVYYRKWIAILRAFVSGPGSTFAPSAATVDRPGPDPSMLLLLILATLPAAVTGLLFEEAIAQQFSSVGSVAVALLFTGVILILAERLPQSRRSHHLGILDAVLIGIAQACALVPGLSRSGLTIAAGRSLKLNRSDALEFSFLMAMPIIAGATVLTLIDIGLGTIDLPST